MKSYLTILFLICAFSVQANNYTKVLKLIERGRYEKAHDHTQKSLRKSSFNPGANYIMSILYHDLNYIDYNQDSAWSYILLAEKQLMELDERSLKRLHRSGVDEEMIVLQKSIVDSAAFQSAIENNTIESFNKFIDNHPKSPHSAEAIQKRDALAWEVAKSENTYQSYLKFLETYPISRQAKEAQELYEVLLYEGKTDDNNLTSYIQFLKDFPDSPYRSEAETHIFNLSVAGVNTSGYIWFLKNYPNSPLASKAVNYLYHLYKEEHDPIGFYNHYAIQPTDSLIKVIQMEYVKIFPVYENGLFGYHDTDWNMVLDYEYDEVDGDHLCGEVDHDFLSVIKGNESKIVNKLGNNIFAGAFENVQDIGNGFLKISRNGEMGLWHKKGYRIFDFGYQDFRLLSNRFLKFKKDDLWGVASFTGIIMLDNLYDDLSSVNGFVLLKKDGKIAIAEPESIISALDHKMSRLEFDFDRAEAIDETYLLAVQDGKEMLIGSGLEVLIPLEDHKIYRLNQGWVVRNHEGFRAYNATGAQIFDTVFVNAMYNERWLALKKQDKWVFFGDDRTFAQGFVYDSINLLSTNFAYLNAYGKPAIYFGNQPILNISLGARIRVLRPSSWSTSEKPVEYLMVSDKNKKFVYDTLGQLILEGPYDQISALGNDYLLLESGVRRGLADNKGNILIKPQYDAIGNYNQGYVSVLKSKKFGIFHQQKKIHISPQYSAMLRPFNDTLLMANSTDWGLIDGSNNRVLEFSYKEIHPWNDQQVLVKSQDNLFSIVDLNSKLIVYSGIERYTMIKDDHAEKIAVFLKRSQHGVLSSKRGEVIAPGFTDIVNLGTAENPIYLAQRTIREAEFIVAVYYAADGSILKRLAMTEDEFDKVYCE